MVSKMIPLSICYLEFIFKLKHAYKYLKEPTVKCASNPQTLHQQIGFNNTFLIYFTFLNVLVCSAVKRYDNAFKNVKALS